MRTTTQGRREELRALVVVLGRGHAPDLVREREKGIGVSEESDGDSIPIQGNGGGSGARGG